MGASVLKAAGESSPPASLRTDFLDGLAGYSIRQTSNRLMAEFVEAIDGTGMRPVLVSILSVVEENPGVNQGLVGAIIGVARANMAPLMNELENAGLIVRQQNSSDRRAVEIYLTSEGAVMLRECKVRILEHEKRILKRLTAEERKTLLRLIRKI